SCSPHFRWWAHEAEDMPKPRSEKTDENIKERLRELAQGLIAPPKRGRPRKPDPASLSASSFPAKAENGPIKEQPPLDLAEKANEEAEEESRRIIYGLGFAAKEHIALAEKLLAVPPKERFDRVIVDRLTDAREGHLKRLRSMVKTVRLLDDQVDEAFLSSQKTA